jgi:hypothetical protein
LRPEVLMPEELEALGSAFDFVSSIIPDELQDPELMEAIAKRMLMRVAAGKLNIVELYLESLCWLRVDMQLAI